MNNEIKEILDRLERIDHKEYSCGFEFADIGSFDEDCRCFEERKKMANYITNLQQENTQLKIQLLEKKCSDKDIEYKEKIKLQQRIDKAIEFTNKNWGTWCTHHLEYMTKLQNILKGSDSNGR